MRTNTQNTTEQTAAFLHQHEQKELLRFVTVGSVDDGKSTLIGRLLHDTDQVYEDQLADAMLRGQINFARITDGLNAEREQGITIDVAYRYFTTEKRKFILADTPGHVQYTRNMVTGASTADVALILIDVRQGVIQQTRRHAFLASLLGIPYLAVAINKMDLVDYAQKDFLRVQDDFLRFTEELQFSHVYCFPISALEGDNIVHRSDYTPWYEGETILSFLEQVPLAQHLEQEAPFRLPVQLVMRPHQDYRGFAGQIVSGSVQQGDRIKVYPSGQESTIEAIDTYEGVIAQAFAPMSITLRLEDEIDISRGDVLVHPEQPPLIRQQLEAWLVWMDEQPLDPSKDYLIKHTTRTVRTSIQEVTGRLDLETLLQDQSIDALHLNDIGKVQLYTHRPLFFDSYAQNR
ncbi:MAG: GTP-binding protein, partial [Myxococcota bacterium]